MEAELFFFKAEELRRNQHAATGAQFSVTGVTLQLMCISNLKNYIIKVKKKKKAI